MSKKFLSVMALFVISLFAIPLVSALDADNFAWMVEVDDTLVPFGNTIGEAGGVEEVVAVVDGVETVVPSVSVEEGAIVEIDVTLHTASAVSDIEVEAEINGYEYDDFDSLEDSTHVFDMAANTQKTVKLEIDLPKKLDKQVYWLFLEISNSASGKVTQIVKLNIEPTRHGVDIADVAFSPGNSVKAGRSLLTTVLLENYGDKHERDVKVTVGIPVLGVSATEFVNVVKTDEHNVDYEDVPEMFLQVPATAAAGEYDVVVTVKYDDLRETVTRTYPINVVANEMFQAGDRLVLAVGPEAQSVAAGQNAVYAVALTNAGATSRAYVLEAVTGGNWATATLSKNLVVLEPGRNEVVYVEVTPAEGAAVGEHLVSLSIKSDSEVLQTIALRTTVTESQGQSSEFSLRNGLELALIILVVLLVIIGLIVGFSRLRRDDEDEEQTYY